MFSIISIMFLGIGIGYLLRNLKFLEKSRKEYFAYDIPATFRAGPFDRLQ